MIQAGDDNVFLRHLNTIGIDKTTTTENMCERLRQLMVNEWDTIRDIQRRPRRLDVASNCIDVLKIPVMLITSLDNFPVTTILPKSGVTSSCTVLYLAFTG